MVSSSLKLCFCLQELSKNVDEYKGHYDSEDQMEWALVLGEIEAFTEVERKQRSQQKVAKHKIIMLTRIRLPCKIPYYMYNDWYPAHFC